MKWERQRDSHYLGQKFQCRTTSSIAPLTKGSVMSGSKTHKTTLTLQFDLELRLHRIRGRVTPSGGAKSVIPIVDRIDNKSFFIKLLVTKNTAIYPKKWNWWVRLFGGFCTGRGRRRSSADNAVRLYES